MTNHADQSLATLPAIFTGVGILTALLCWPLAKGKIPPNRIYGIRTKRAFSSEENWYKENKRGGKLLGISSLFIALIGLTGFLVPQADMVIYALTGAVLVLVLTLGPAIIFLLGR